RGAPRLRRVPRVTGGYGGPSRGPAIYMVGIDRRLLQNVDWPLLGATVGLVILSASTRASLHVGRAGGGVAVRQIAWCGVGLIALVVMASLDYRRAGRGGRVPFRLRCTPRG